ncbi:MAG TPA: 2Fe-2S iron-sulfur cluster-binding protein [Candidatus Binataceae bacterium]|nr:2Fe-2S iron-sulfur cluster-binding protein [Candidatus Binataceae bacterium]
MNPRDEEAELARRIRAAARGHEAWEGDGLRERFAVRLSESAARPDAVPVEIDGRKLEARRGATVLAAAMKNGIRLMHVCGARKLCATCRVKITAGAQYLSPMSPRERLSLRAHLSVSPRTRLGCQARIEGPIEAETVFPLCGDIPAEDSQAEKSR